MEWRQCLQARRSVRAYRSQPVAEEQVRQILRAGTLAPSGKNGQPWKFLVVQRDKALLAKLADLTLYRSFVARADCLVCVFLDKLLSYHYLKDAQAVGACIENMLLEAADLGLGACWIGEILNRDLFVKQALGLDHRYDLMAVIALGAADDEADAPRPAKRPWQDSLLEWR